MGTTRTDGEKVELHQEVGTLLSCTFASTYLHCIIRNGVVHLYTSDLGTILIEKKHLPTSNLGTT